MIEYLAPGFLYSLLKDGLGLIRRVRWGRLWEVWWLWLCSGLLFGAISGGLGVALWLTLGSTPNIPEVEKWMSLTTATDTLVPAEITRAYYQLTKEWTDWSRQIDTARAEIFVAASDMENQPQREPQAMEAARNRITQLENKLKFAGPLRARALDTIVQYFEDELRAGRIIAKGYDQDKKMDVYIARRVGIFAFDIAANADGGACSWRRSLGGA